MSSNWVNALDNLAAGGVIDFDAPAYLLDQPARYIGHPKFSELPMTDISLLPEGVKLKDIPQIDNFNNSNKNIVQTPKWKKWLLVTLAAAGAVGLAVLGLSKVKKVKLPKVNSQTFTKIKTTLKKK